MRFACLYVPDFPLAAVLRGEPELRGEPVVVVDGPGPRAALRGVSPAAARRGVAVGASVAQAMAIAADLVVRVIAPAALRAAQAALCDAAGSVSPRIEDAGDGTVYLDLQGLAALYESESQLANVLAQRAAQLGLDAQVGVGGSKVAASLAARNGGGVVVIPTGEEWSFLAPVPVTLLAPSPSLVATLQRWGIRTIGDLAALPARAVGTRLGPEGVLLMRRARGEDDQPLVPRVLPLHFEEALDLEYGIDSVEACVFVLRGMLARLTARLAVRGLVCGDLRLSMRLATRGRDERTVVVAAPSNDVKALLALARLHLEAHPPLAAVEAIRLSAVPECLRAAQLDLFRPNGPAPERLAVTLARLTVLCGADRVGTPVVADSHRPDAYGIQAVRGLGGYGVRGQEQQGVKGLRGYGVKGQENESVTPNPLTPNPFPSHCPVALRAFRPPQAVEVFCERDRPEFVRGVRGLGCYGVSEQGKESSTPNPQHPNPLTANPLTPNPFPSHCPVALRAFRPPQAVEVFCERDRPEFVRGDDLAGRVVHAAGPWRVHGDWWHDGTFSRDYYDAQLSDGCVYRLYRDLATQHWFVDGVYD